MMKMSEIREGNELWCAIKFLDAVVVVRTVRSKACVDSHNFILGATMIEWCKNCHGCVCWAVVGASILCLTHNSQLTTHTVYHRTGTRACSGSSGTRTSNPSHRIPYTGVCCTLRVHHHIHTLLDPHSHKHTHIYWTTSSCIPQSHK